MCESSNVNEKSFTSKHRSRTKILNLGVTHTGAAPQARPSTTLPEELLSAAVSADLAGTWGEPKEGRERK